MIYCGTQLGKNHKYFSINCKICFYNLQQKGDVFFLFRSTPTDQDAPMPLFSHIQLTRKHLHPCKNQLALTPPSHPLFINLEMRYSVPWKYYVLYSEYHDFYSTIITHSSSHLKRLINFFNTTLYQTTHLFIYNLITFDF